MGEGQRGGMDEKEEGGQREGQKEGRDGEGKEKE